MSTGRGLLHWLAALLVAAEPTAAKRQAETSRRGSASEPGCGDRRWQHVYRPERLTVLRSCVAVSGTIVDATRNQSVHRESGVRHEPDGDTHGWLRPDSQFVSPLNAGNRRHESGNIVFEAVCHWKPMQHSAIAACANYIDQVRLLPVGTHVVIIGTLAMDDSHARWIEIHPVSSIEARK